jgi:chromosome segregation ATPase
MNRKIKPAAKAVAPQVQIVKEDNKTQAKKSKKNQQIVNEHLEKLKETNGDLVDLKRNIKQTQSQLTQLEETNGKNKKQKMTNAQNNVKNLKKRQAELEKQVKGVLGQIRGLGEEVNLESKCRDLPAVLEIVLVTAKKKKEVGKVEEKKKEQVPEAKKVARVEPEPAKLPHESSSIFGRTSYTPATFSMPPHFSEFNKSPPKETAESRHEQVRINRCK